MKDQEKAERLRFKAELKKEAVELIRVIAEIGLLERKLDLKQRELHKLKGSILDKQKKAALDDSEKLSLGAFSKQPETQREAISARLVTEWGDVDSRLKAIGVEDAACFFDNPQNLQVTVVYDGQPNVTVDLIKSVRANARNIGHPLVVEAIRRYVLLISRSSSQTSEQNLPSDRKMKPSVAKSNLDRLFRAVIADAERKPLKAERQSLHHFLFSSHIFSLDYFEKLWGFLHDPAIKDLKRGGTKIEFIKRRLVESYPEEDHGDVLEYLENALKDNPEVKIPLRGGGGALRNTFLGWKNKISPKSAKEYVSKGQRWIKDFVSKLPPDTDLTKILEFSEDEKSEIVDDFMFAWLGIGHMKPYEDLSKLVMAKDSSISEDADI